MVAMVYTCIVVNHSPDLDEKSEQGFSGVKTSPGLVGL
jgi:hypothetical protein